MILISGSQLHCFTPIVGMPSINQDLIAPHQVSQHRAETLLVLPKNIWSTNQKKQELTEYLHYPGSDVSSLRLCSGTETGEMMKLKSSSTGGLVSATMKSLCMHVAS